MKSIFEKMGITYHWEGDYLIPDLEPPEAPRIGKYGTMRHNYLRDYHTGVFDGMLFKGTLNQHLEQVDREVNEMVELLITQMAKVEGVTEALKAQTRLNGSAERTISKIKVKKLCVAN